MLAPQGPEAWEKGREVPRAPRGPLGKLALGGAAWPGHLASQTNSGRRWAVPLHGRPAGGRLLVRQGFGWGIVRGVSTLLLQTLSCLQIDSPDPCLEGVALGSLAGLWCELDGSTVSLSVSACPRGSKGLISESLRALRDTRVAGESEGKGVRAEECAG